MERALRTRTPASVLLLPPCTAATVTTLDRCVDTAHIDRASQPLVTCWCPNLSRMERADGHLVCGFGRIRRKGLTLSERVGSEKSLKQEFAG
ncbi:hypothetical protein DFP72DRAFT_466892 [Ephemerocybe angulata]|uniref:Secreted protein n=1 Tax=Ephemerocybe angulata TaxID=980116 RepID=A0A8H6HU56_9AGAR|nr:hypothetical protein DFP72DRAFT_466892 [Tulosesus angulatus]